MANMTPREHAEQLQAMLVHNLDVAEDTTAPDAYSTGELLCELMAMYDDGSFGVGYSHLFPYYAAARSTSFVLTAKNQRFILQVLEEVL